ncbi:MAG: hypothetical protein KAJ28_03910 [Flavobacteriaceae bacterium]|nr:hypothetical protein [Flavobacteriaceae bacterium]
MLKPHPKSNLNQLVIYQKSMDIFKLTRHIASFISQDKDILSMHKSIRKVDHYASNLVMDALGLVPKIAETENQKNPILKLKYAKSLSYFIDRLYNNSLKLEKTKTQGKEFLKLFRKELKQLRKLHKQYVNSIL